MNNSHLLKKVIALTAACTMTLGSGAVSASAAAAEEGVLRTAVLYDITTMDVAETTDDYLIPMNVFDRLFETRMIDGTAQVINSLCKEYKVSEDGKTYDFVLKDGIVFSNGSVYLGSTHSYPHGTQHIADNNFAGHSCLHFPRTQEQVEKIGQYATSHQETIDAAWARTQSMK